MWLSFWGIPMQDGDYRIRTMRREEVDIAVEWATQEGWNPGLGDADCFYAADPNGFLIGLLEDEPIATISVVKYGRSFGFLGFYIVKPGYRGKGYGIRIWDAGLKYLEGRNVGLDGVAAQQENYRKSGFKLAYRNIRYEGRGAGKAARPSGIVELSGLPFKAVEAYDRPFFPADRTQFLQPWIRQAGGKALGIMQNGALAGYGIIRRCRSGYKIGPLFADSPDLAEALFVALTSEIEPTAPVYLDTPQVNPAAAELAERHDMKVVFETARMYTRETPNMPLDRLFGVTTFELG
jgi:ribosomal protein S18 acetylase RimI-like enzyme